MPVLTSELTRLEMTSAAAAAHSAGRIEDLTSLLQRFEADCGVDGPVALLAFDAPVVLPAARQLVLDHSLRTLDAVHLAVATTTVRDLFDDEDDGIVIVTTSRRTRHGRWASP